MIYLESARKENHSVFSADPSAVTLIFESRPMVGWVSITANGSLDSTEIQQFASKIGLKLSMEEAEEAVSEMELTEKKDGVVEFDEFWHWFTCVQAPYEQTS